MNLKNVTLVAVACTNVFETIQALKYSSRNIKFADGVLITHEKVTSLPYGIRIVIIDKLDYYQYNHFVLFRLKDYIKSQYCLLIQNDGYVLRPHKWDKRFFSYDYIGAPWQKNVHFTKEGKNIRVGNGGFSFRSKKLLWAPTKLNLPFTDNGTGFHHEDGFISVYYRTQLEKYGIKVAPVEIASLFSREVTCDDSVAFPFGFHSKTKFPRLLFLQPLLQKIRIFI